MSDQALLVTSSPHLRSGITTRSIMRDVIIALLPALGGSLAFFGLPALVLIVVTTAAAVLGEFLVRVVLLKRDNTIGDLSAVVTGILLAMNLPPGLPWWIAVVGGLLATGFIKQLFGGLGQNFMNPAMGARVFLFLAWTGPMTTFLAPGTDAVAGPTPLKILAGQEAAGATMPSYWDLLIGHKAGCLGETSVILLLIGAGYLLVRRIISPRIPLVYLGTVALMTWLFGATEFFQGDFVAHLLSGGLILGAFFMATDYATQPVSPLGKTIYGLGLGLLTGVIRLFTSYPEGVSFAIILMNSLVPLIDRYTIPRSFGGRRA